jgi:hypothetical protein
MNRKVSAARTVSAAAATLMALLVAGCSAGAGAGAKPTPTPTLPPALSPTASSDFTMDVLPAEDPPEGRPAVPGQKVSFLVVVTSPGNDAPVTISATATGAQITDIKPAQLKPGVVGEVWLVPGAATEEATVTVNISATRGGVTKTDQRSTRIMPFEDDRAEQAQPYFDMWVDWLAANHPEFGITKSTKWESSYVLALLIVSHYAYFSDEWEMKVSWHIMIAPDDFTEVYLRHRGDETAWSHAFRMDSFTNKTAPHEITPDPFMR